MERARRDPAGQPRPAAADPDDDASRSSPGMIPLVRLERRRLGHQPRDRLRHHRRPDARAPAHAARHAGRLLAVRRPAVSCSPGGARVARARPSVPRGRRGAWRWRAVLVLRVPAAAQAPGSRLQRSPGGAAAGAAGADSRRSGSRLDDAAAPGRSSTTPTSLVDRLDPEVSAERVAQAQSAFMPSLASAFSRNSQLAPPTSFLVGTRGRAERRDHRQPSAVSQRLPWFGTSYAVGVGRPRTDQQLSFTNFNPSLTARLQVSFSQPLLEGPRAGQRAPAADPRASGTATSPTPDSARRSSARWRA